MKKYVAVYVFIIILVVVAWLLGNSEINIQADRRKQVIYLTSFGSISDKESLLAKSEIEKFYGIEVVRVPKRALPRAAFCKVRKRYVALKLLHLLRDIKLSNYKKVKYKVLAITNKDIETEKGRHWGVMGLAFLGGDQAVVSTHRLQNQNERFKKVVLHETGHMLGINHCISGNINCFMIDAKGKGAIIDRASIFICNNCSSKINF